VRLHLSFCKRSKKEKNRICQCEGTSDSQNKTILNLYFFICCEHHVTQLFYLLRTQCYITKNSKSLYWFMLMVSRALLDNILACCSLIKNSALEFQHLNTETQGTNNHFTAVWLIPEDKYESKTVIHYVSKCFWKSPSSCVIGGKDPLKRAQPL